MQNNSLVGTGIWVQYPSSINSTVFIDDSNTVNGKKFRVLVNETGLPNDALDIIGQAMLINVSNSTFRDHELVMVQAYNCTGLSFTNFTSAFEFHGTNFSHVSSSTITMGAGEGCKLYQSDSNTIFNNSFHSIPGEGLWLEESNGNDAWENVFSDNVDAGLVMIRANDNLIYNNTFENNSEGLWVTTHSTGNDIYFNYFIGNGDGNAIVTPEILLTGNNWNNGTTGNYWDDYTFYYPSAGNDGITWDHAYELNRTWDHHPLVAPFVADTLPSANFTLNNASGSILPNQSLEFTFTGYGGNAPFSIEWNFGDGTLAFNQTTASHVYPVPGTYTVALAVVDANGDSSFFSIPGLVQVVDSTPAASFVHDYAGYILAGGTVHFTFTGDPGDTPATFAWDFGDGTAPATTANATHAFGIAGSFVVTLVVTDVDGDNATSAPLLVRVLSPGGDDDGDGFSNGDEVNAGKDPLDPGSHPPDYRLAIATVAVTGTVVGAVAITTIVKRRMKGGASP